MRYQAMRFIAIFLVICSFGVAFAAPSLEVQEVKKLYKDGEFEKIRDILEDFLKRNDKTAHRDQKVLAYKYLGVIHATKPGGKSQAETYFFRLLELAPNVQLTELYVSSSVEDVFQKTKERHAKETKYASQFDEYGNPISGKREKSDSREDGDAMLKAAGGLSRDTAAVKPKERPVWNAEKKNKNLEKSASGGPRIWPWLLGAALVGGGVGLYLYTSDNAADKEDVVVQGPTL